MKKYIILFFVLIGGGLIGAAAAYAFSISQCSGPGQALGYDTTLGFICTNPLTPVTHMGSSSGVSVSVGALSLGTKTVVVTGLTGMLANDACLVSYQSAQSPIAGLIISGCSATANGQATVIFSTPIGLGISAGTVSLNFAWFG